MVSVNREASPPDAPFELLPAIDLRGGRVVRLRQGDFARETVYGDGPVAVAQRFADAGAAWLHVVDLDGARGGGEVQAPTVQAIVRAVGDRLACEVAGGLRDEAAVEGALRAGAARVVVGTAALRDPAFAGRLVARHGSARIVVALDVRGGVALGDGWRPGATGRPVLDVLARIAEAGVTRFAVTAIDRDGLLAGPDLDLLGRLVDVGRGRIIASGGIRSVADVLAARDRGCAGAIVGRALYEGGFDLAEAMTALGGS